MMERRHPKVDVLIPVRSPAPWLDLALDSVVKQSSRDWRLLVVMDGFSQEVEDTCHALPAHTPIRVEVLPAGSGLIAALNHGLDLCCAEYVARLDADDVCHPDRFERQIEYLDSNPECMALGTGVRLIDENGTPLGVRTRRSTGSVMRLLKWRCPIAHPSTMMRRVDVLQVGGYSPGARHAEDYDLWLRLAAVGEIHALESVLLDYRVHAGQVTSKLTFPKETSDAVKSARTATAVARRESPLAAHLRHSIWKAVNSAKGR